MCVYRTKFDFELQMIYWVIYVPVCPTSDKFRIISSKITFKSLVIPHGISTTETRDHVDERGL